MPPFDSPIEPAISSYVQVSASKCEAGQARMPKGPQIEGAHQGRSFRAKVQVKSRL